MLFSEPKIPQFKPNLPTDRRRERFSALQRAENSSMRDMCSSTPTTLRVSVLFSEPKIPQFDPQLLPQVPRSRFSALQRAENSSIDALKLLTESGLRFSALQRAENSSIQQALDAMTELVKFQCSSASRKFLNRNKSRRAVDRSVVSVLFSEPKIPQSFGRCTVQLPP